MGLQVVVFSLKCFIQWSRIYAESNAISRLSCKSDHLAYPVSGLINGRYDTKIHHSVKLLLDTGAQRPLVYS